MRISSLRSSADNAPHLALPPFRPMATACGFFRLVELCLGCPDPAATVQAWQGSVETAHLREGEGYLVRLGDTLIRVVPGEDLTVVMKSRCDGPTAERLAALVPGVRFASVKR